MNPDLAHQIVVHPEKGQSLYCGALFHPSGRDICPIIAQYIYFMSAQRTMVVLISTRHVIIFRPDCDDPELVIRQPK